MSKSGTGAERRERLNALREAALHRPVSARRFSEGFSGRWSRRQWAHASLFATLGMLVAAIVPGFGPSEPSPASTQRLSMTLPLPLARMHSQAGDSWQLVRVERGQTLGALFAQMNIPAATMHRILEQPGAKQALTRLRPGAELAFDLPVNGGLRAFRYDRDETHRVELTLDGDRVDEKVIERPTETRTVVISGKVGRSLFRSARKLGLSGNNINTLTDEIFKYDIDFNEDVGDNDRFSVVVEQTWREGELIKSGPVLAATFTTGKKLHTGFRFERKGKAEYFTGDGRPLKKSFIRMPIPYARLTSGFGARRHPVLGRMRMHKSRDPRFIRLARFLLEGRDLDVEELTTPERLPESMLEPNLDLALLDGGSSVADALRTANAARARRPEMPIVIAADAGGKSPSGVRVFDRWNDGGAPARCRASPVRETRRRHSSRTGLSVVCASRRNDSGSDPVGDLGSDHAGLAATDRSTSDAGRKIWISRESWKVRS